METVEGTVGAEPARYCRRCGYALRGLLEARCPECGRGFDPGDARTYLRKPPRRGWKWVRRAGVALGVVVMLIGAAWGWEYWGWKQEQWALGEIDWTSCGHDARLPHWLDTEGSPRAHWLKEHIGAAGFVLERTTSLWIQDRRLELNPPPLDFSRLASFTRLETLKLESYYMTDLTPLAGMADLQSLSISGRNLKDLSPLRGLGNMRHLNLFGATQVSDYSALSGMSRLEQLSLNGSAIQDLSPLSRLTNLSDLELRRTKVTDLAPLSAMRTSLKFLNISETPARDFKPLYGLMALRMLQIGALIPAPEVDALRRALPGCILIQD